MVFCILHAALGQHDRRKRNHRAVRVGQHFVDHAVARDGGKGRCALRAQHDEVGLLRSAW